MKNLDYKRYTLIFLFYMMLFQDALESKIAFLTFLDEAISLVVFGFAVIKIISSRNKYKLKDYNKKILIGLMLLVTIGLTSNLTYRYFMYQSTGSAIVILLKDMLLVSKGWLTYIFIPTALSDVNVDEYLNILSNHFKKIAVLSLLLIIADYIFKIFPTYEIRFGIRSEQLMFTHPTYLASFAVLVIIVLSITIENFKDDWKYIMMMIIVLASTLRFKAIAFIPVYLYVIFIVYKKQRKLQLKDVILLGLLGLIFAISQVWEYANNPEWARSALSMKSLLIARDHFPLGSGFGSFASWTSGQYYSPIYYNYGLFWVWGLSPDFYGFVADTFWPMVIGQFGYIGFIVYCIILFMVYKNINETQNLNLYLGQILLLLHLLILSTAEASFSGPISVVFLGLISILRKDDKKKQYCYN